MWFGLTAPNDSNELHKARVVQVVLSSWCRREASRPDPGQVAERGGFFLYGDLLGGKRC